MKRYTMLVLFLFSVLFSNPMPAQGFTNWVSGDTTDYIPPAGVWPGLLLAGGGSDNDSAMVWMLRRAGGGDVVVLRASGKDGYNSYLFTELGVPVHSVETIRFDNDSASVSPYIIHKIRSAELLFIAGGDQYDYYKFWKDKPIEDAINYLIHEKKVTVGGTSAGMAILGEAYYTPSAGSLQSAEALGNPFHINTNIVGKGDFIHVPFMQNLITDTHYDQRNRQGRHLTFMARLTARFDTRMYGIACNEHVAVAVDGNGVARVFGSDDASDEYAYFLCTNASPDIQPETLVDGQPLTWNCQKKAVKVYQLPGAMAPKHTFDLNDWQTATGGNWQYWYVEQGVVRKN